MSTLKTVEVIERRWTVEVYPPDGSVRELDIRLPTRVSLLMVGTQGPRGPAGAAEAYIHEQLSPADEWIVTHNFGERPLVDVTDTGGNVVQAQVLHVSDNQLRVYFTTAQTGYVRSI